MSNINLSGSVPIPFGNNPVLSMSTDSIFYNNNIHFKNDRQDMDKKNNYGNLSDRNYFNNLVDERIDIMSVDSTCALNSDRKMNEDERI
jgi:hypothetical protein